MNGLITTILIFFIILKTKEILFWIYLWQLKNYHIKRFLAHFSTYNGRKLMYDKKRIIKSILLSIFLIGLLFNFQTNLLFYISSLLLFFIYILELILTILRKIILPVFNIKTIFLSLVSILSILSLTFLYFNNLETTINYLLFFYVPVFILFLDICIPLLVSLIVLSLQPITVIYRTIVIESAKNRIKEVPNLKVIGITGSYGKSSTKEYLYEIIKNNFNVIKTPKNLNSEMGISQTILKDLRNEHTIFICEMGAYSKGGINFLTEIAKPEIGILTGINEQHLATFGSQKNIIDTKFELIDSLPGTGHAILNTNNSIIKKELKERKFRVENIVPISDIADLKNKDGIIEFKYKKGNFKLNLLGAENVIENMLLAIDCALILGVPIKTIEKNANAIRDRKLFENSDHIKVIDSTYSSNPNGVITEINYLSTFKGKKILVMPCLIELGTESKRIHNEIGKVIAKNCDMAIITSNDYYADIKEGTKEFQNIFLIKDNEKIIEKLSDFVKEGDVILFENRIANTVINEFLPFQEKRYD